LDLEQQQRAVAIVHALRHFTAATRWAAERRVSEWPPDVVGAIVALDHPSAAVRRQAVEALARPA
jgi:hypothetical protein